MLLAPKSVINKGGYTLGRGVIQIEIKQSANTNTGDCISLFKQLYLLPLIGSRWF